LKLHLTTHIADDARPRLAHGVRLQADAATGKNVLLYPEGVLELNETAQAILTRCDGKTVVEITRLLGEEYEADHMVIIAELRETLAELQRRKLIELA
jgi:coenzyme PQQ biosynthesis protein PqqD